MNFQLKEGIHVSPKDIDDLLDDFVVGEMVEILSDEDGHEMKWIQY